MASIRETLVSAADPATCWALLADFGAIDVFNPNLKKSFLLDGAPAEGLGALRQCDLSDGKNYIRERVVRWEEGRSYTVDIYEGTMPLKSAQATLKVDPHSRGSMLTMQINYIPKFGPLGRLMDVLMMRRMMRKQLTKVLVGLNDAALNGDAMFAAA